MTTSTEETMTTSATGGMKASKIAQLGAIDPLALLKLAEVAGFGAEKYDSFNYLKGYDWSLSYNAMQRHALAFWNGEDNDPESGLPHMLHAAWHGLAMSSFLLRDLGTDDRFVQSESVDHLTISTLDGVVRREQSSPTLFGDYQEWEIAHPLCTQPDPVGSVVYVTGEEGRDEIGAHEIPIGTEVMVIYGDEDYLYDGTYYVNSEAGDQAWVSANNLDVDRSTIDWW